MSKGKEGCNKNDDCSFLHPKMGSGQLKCNKINCKFLHPSKRKVKKDDEKNDEEPVTTRQDDKQKKTKSNVSNATEQTVSNTVVDPNFQEGRLESDTSQMREMKDAIKSLTENMKEISASVKILLQERETLRAWNWNPYQGQIPQQHNFTQ